jgi:hypothetical protein
MEEPAGRSKAPASDGAVGVICDDIICSSEAGTLKAKTLRHSSDPWLAAHGVGFTDAVLIDDRADNCNAFTSRGGITIQWKMGTSDVREVTRGLRQWLDDSFGAAPAPTARTAPAAS